MRALRWRAFLCCQAQHGRYGSGKHDRVRREGGRQSPLERRGVKDGLGGKSAFKKLHHLQAETEMSAYCGVYDSTVSAPALLKLFCVQDFVGIPPFYSLPRHSTAHNGGFSTSKSCTTQSVSSPPHTSALHTYSSSLLLHDKHWIQIVVFCWWINQLIKIKVPLPHKYIYFIFFYIYFGRIFFRRENWQGGRIFRSTYFDSHLTLQNSPTSYIELMF